MVLRGRLGDSAFRFVQGSDRAECYVRVHPEAARRCPRQQGEDWACGAAFIICSADQGQCPDLLAVAARGRRRCHSRRRAPPTGEYRSAKTVRTGGQHSHDGGERDECAPPLVVAGEESTGLVQIERATESRAGRG